MPYAIPSWIQAGSKAPVSWWDYSREKFQAIILLFFIKLKMLHFQRSTVENSFTD